MRKPFLAVAICLACSFYEATTLAESTCPDWVSSQAYPANSCVNYQGTLYKTQWWANEGVIPAIGEHPWDSPWVRVDGPAPVPPPSKNVPGQPRIHWMQPISTPGQPVQITWTLDWGITGTTWEIWDNKTKKIFTSNTFTGQTNTTQTGNTTLNLANGAHQLTVKLCNQNGCTDSTTSTISVGADQNKTPTAPQLSPIPPINQGENIFVTWNMYWGDTGSTWTISIDQKNVLTSDQFTINQANTQAGEAQIDSKTLSLTSGTHQLTLKLCNGNHCSEDNKNFTVTGEPPHILPSQPIVDPIPDSTNKHISLHWKTTGVKGVSWLVTDQFNQSTQTVFPRSTVFDSSSTDTTQSGTAGLTLENGQHLLTVQLCNAYNECTNSQISKVNIVLPPPPVPGTPTLDRVPDATDGNLAVHWKTTEQGGDYWELQNNNQLMQTFYQFADQTNQSGQATLPVSNGTYNLTVKLCNADKVCQTSNMQTATISGAPDKKASFVAYYPSWHTPYFNLFCPTTGTYSLYTNGPQLPCVPNTLLPNDYVIRHAALAGAIPDYVTHVIIAFGKLNQMHQYTGLSNHDSDLQKMGIQFNASSASVKAAIDALKQKNPGTKVLLALGGASYNDSWNQITEADITQLGQLITDLDLDGVDVDYEVSLDPANPNPVVEQYDNAIISMRKAVDLATQKTKKQHILSLAAWSTGADCTAKTQDAALYPQCVGKLSYWGGNAGRERMVLQGKKAAALIDLINVMSYDADYQHFDPVVAYHQYRQLVKSNVPVNIGLEPSPDEGWGGARTFVDDRGINNDCIGNTILQDQYGTKTPGTFSVQRFATAVKQNPGDGIMIWSLFAYRRPLQCGSVPMSDVTEIGRGISNYLRIGTNRTMQIDYNTLISYVRDHDHP